MEYAYWLLTYFETMFFYDPCPNFVISHHLWLLQLGVEMSFLPNDQDEVEIEVEIIVEVVPNSTYSLSIVKDPHNLFHLLIHLVIEELYP